MKKLTILFLCLMLILPLIAAKDIVYITKTAGGDNVLMDLISEKGYTADVVNINNINSVNFSNYKMILLGNEDFTSAEAKKIPINTKNSVVLDTKGLTQWGWSTNGAASITSGSPRNLPVWNKTSSIVSGIGDEFPQYVDIGFNKGDYTFYYISNSKKPAGMNTIVADALSFRILPQQYVVRNGAVIGTISPGVTLTNGNISQARGLFFGITNTELWTNDTKTIFKNSLDWAIKGEDMDNDGFWSDADCNDANANINPNAAEIPYNYIDENCDGKDLADVDADGYCKAGYIIMNKTLQCSKETGIVGTDCNDNDASYNIGSTDLKKNCINDAPVFSGLISNQTWNEDESTEINLNWYFSDPDGDSLTYSIYNTSLDNNITLSFLSNGTLKFESSANWNGNDWIVLKADDGNKSVLSNKIILTVNPVNDAPVLDSISDINIVEGQIAEITATATDPEGDSIAYFTNDTRFQKDNNTFRWQTQIGDAGNYKIKINAEDNKGAISSKNVSVEIIPKILINEFVSNPQEGTDWVELYNPGNQTVNLDNCVLKDGNDNELDLNGLISSKGFLAFNWENKLNNEGSIIELYCKELLTDKVTYGNWDDGNVSDNAPAPSQGKSSGRDPDGKDTGVNADDFKIFENPTKNLMNNADVILPIVSLISPENGTFFDKRAIEFNFTASDDRAEKLNCQIYINNLPMSSLIIDNGTIGNLILDTLIDGNYTWNIKCSDGFNSVFAPDNLTFQISAPDAPVLNPIGSKTISENKTLNFEISATDSDLGDSVNLTAENLPDGASFIDNSNGKGNFSWTPNYQQAGDYDIKFTAKDTTGLEDSETVRITVGNAKEPPKFSDIKLCKEITPEIGITIQNPNDGDSFNIGDTIKGKVTIDNSANESLSTDLMFYLYDTTSEKVVEREKKSVYIKKEDSKDVEFEMNVSEDLKEGHEFAVFVKAEAIESIDYCSQEYINIGVERKSYNVIIDEITLNPESAQQGGYANVKVKLKNIGGEDENAYVKLENAELNLSQESEKIAIGNYWNDNEKTTEFSFKIPENSEKKDYQIIATVFFDDGKEKNSELVDLTVSENKGSLEISQIAPISLASSVTEATVKKTESILKGLEYEITFTVSVFLLLFLISLVKREKAGKN